MKLIKNSLHTISHATIAKYYFSDLKEVITASRTYAR